MSLAKKRTLWWWSFKPCQTPPCFPCVETRLLHMVAKLASAATTHTSLHRALLDHVGPIGLSQKSEAVSAQPASLWPPQVSGTNTLCVYPCHQLSSHWTSFGIRLNRSKKLLPCCVITGVLGKCTFPKKTMYLLLPNHSQISLCYHLDRCLSQKYLWRVVLKDSKILLAIKTFV